MRCPTTRTRSTPLVGPRHATFTWAVHATVLAVVLPWASVAVGSDQRKAFDHIEQRPYRVRIRVGFADDPTLTAFVRDRAIADLRRAAAATFGASWTVDVVRETGTQMSTVDDLERLEPAAFATPGADPDLEKLFLVTLSADRGTYTAAAREYDTTVRRLGNVVLREGGRRDDLGSLMFRAIHEAYAPLVMVEGIEGRNVVVRPFGGEFTPPDDTAAVVGPGSLVAPYLRYLDKTGEVGHIVPIPWTYLRVPDEEVVADAAGADEVAAGSDADDDADDEGLLVAETISGLQSPMGTKIRKRVQVFALLERPAFASTSVTLVPRNAPGTPAIGVRVMIVRKVHAGDEGEGDPLEGMTDRLGRVEIPRDDAAPLSWLYVHSGTALLARVPIVAGGAKRLTFAIPDDQPRLEVEGAIELLQADLIDAVAVRETLLRRIKILARDAKWTDVDRLLPEVDELPTAATFERRLSAISATDIERARAAGNPRAAFGIEKMVEKTRDRIRRFVDEKRIFEMRTELEELRKLDAGDAADPASLDEAGLGM